MVSSMHEKAMSMKSRWVGMIKTKKKSLKEMSKDFRIINKVPSKPEYYHAKHLLSEDASNTYAKEIIWHYKNRKKLRTIRMVS